MSAQEAEAVEVARLQAFPAFPQRGSRVALIQPQPDPHTPRPDILQWLFLYFGVKILTLGKGRSRSGRCLPPWHDARSSARTFHCGAATMGGHPIRTPRTEPPAPSGSLLTVPRKWKQPQSPSLRNR